MKEHELKTWPEFFDEIWSGRKTFEVRYNDRDYQVGDVLFLREWSPLTRGYTGRETRLAINYILDDPDRRFGLEPGYVVMAVAARPLFAEHNGRLVSTDLPMPDETHGA